MIRKERIVSEYANIGLTKDPHMDESGDSFVKTRIITGKCAAYAGAEAVARIKNTRSVFGFYASHKIATRPGYDLVQLTFVDLILSPTTGSVSRFNLADNMVNRPIEQHSAYKTIWNHRVIAPQGTTITESQWTGLTDTKPPSGYTGEARWAKTNQALPSSSEVILEATKPGVQTYRVPAPVVLERLYTRKKEILDETLAKKGKLKAPAQTYNAPPPAEGKTVNEYWLVNKAKTVLVNDWYEVHLEYQYADVGWDTDLYDDADA